MRNENGFAFGFMEECVHFLFWNEKLTWIRILVYLMQVNYESYNTKERKGRGHLYFSYITAVAFAKQNFFSVLNQNGKCLSRIEYEKTMIMFKGQSVSTIVALL